MQEEMLDHLPFCGFRFGFDFGFSLCKITASGKGVWQEMGKSRGCSRASYWQMRIVDSNNGRLSGQDAIDKEQKRVFRERIVFSVYLVIGYTLTWYMFKAIHGLVEFGYRHGIFLP